MMIHYVVFDNHAVGALPFF